MNVERLYDTVSAFLKLEDELQVQPLLADLVERLTAVVQNPTEPSYQTKLVEGELALRDALVAAQVRLAPVELAALDALQGESHFDERMYTFIKNTIVTNGMTPAVALAEVQKVRNKRQTYISQLAVLRDAFNVIGVSGNRLPDGAVELSVLLPGSLFDDDLFQLSRELKVVNDILRAFSETATGMPEKVKLVQVSSSDPTFFLGLNVETVVMIAAAITWILSTIKSTMDIRAARGAAQRVKMPDEIVQAYDLRMKQVMEDAIRSHAKELAEKSAADEGRQKELNTMLVKAMTAMSARIERGMRIEVVLSVNPPADPEGQQAKVYTELKAMSQSMKYEQIDGPPVLAIAAPEEDADLPG